MQLPTTNDRGVPVDYICATEGVRMCVCDGLFVVKRSLEQNVKSSAVVKHQKDIYGL